MAPSSSYNMLRIGLRFITHHSTISFITTNPTVLSSYPALSTMASWEFPELYGGLVHWEHHRITLQ